MAKFKNILNIIYNKKKSNRAIEIEFTKDDIFKICNIHPGDRISNYNIGRISSWINVYLKYHIPEIKVLLYGESVYITDSLKVTYDNIHTRYPSGNMHKHKFDFKIKRLNDTDFRDYKNCGISSIIIPECGVYIITTGKGQYIGSSRNMCNRLRWYISLSNNEDLQFGNAVKIRLPIKLITIYECPSESHAKYLEERLISELCPRLNKNGDEK